MPSPKVFQINIRQVLTLAQRGILSTSDDDNDDDDDDEDDDDDDDDNDDDYDNDKNLPGWSSGPLNSSKAFCENISLVSFTQFLMSTRSSSVIR